MGPSKRTLCLHTGWRRALPVSTPYLGHSLCQGGDASQPRGCVCSAVKSRSSREGQRSQAPLQVLFWAGAGSQVRSRRCDVNSLGSSAFRRKGQSNPKKHKLSLNLLGKTTRSQASLGLLTFQLWPGIHSYCSDQERRRGEKRGKRGF